MRAVNKRFGALGKKRAVLGGERVGRLWGDVLCGLVEGGWSGRWWVRGEVRRRVHCVLGESVVRIGFVLNLV